MKAFKVSYFDQEETLKEIEIKALDSDDALTMALWKLPKGTILDSVTLVSPEGPKLAEIIRIDFKAKRRIA